MRSEAARRQMLVTTLSALVGVAGVLNITLTADADEPPDGLIQRLLAQTTRGAIAVRATRHLQAGTISGNHRGWMNVETAVSASGAFSWDVISEGGSERTRDNVFRAVLQAESKAWRAGARDAAALSLANYEFVPVATAGSGLNKLQLKPRRADSRLVAGTLTVTADGHPVLLQGRLAKSPSFWVRSVTIVKRYERVGGVSLPVEIESLADVKLFGKSSFSMRYNYSAVNGRGVGHTASAAPSFGPSAHLLALYTQLNAEQ
jgi:hypothetical protein